MSITDSIKLKFIKRQLLKPQRSRHILLKNPSEFTRILILSNRHSDEELELAASIFPHAEVNECSVRKEKEDQSGKFRYTIHPSDFNLTGGIKNDKLKKLMNLSFDLTIDLSSNSEWLRYILINTQSTLVIGRMENSEEGYYDLFLESGADNSTFIKNIAVQLNKLQAYAK